MVSALLFGFFLGSSKQFSSEKVAPLLYIVNSFLYKSDITHLSYIGVSSSRHSLVSCRGYDDMITRKLMKKKRA